MSAEVQQQKNQNSPCVIPGATPIVRPTRDCKIQDQGALLSLYLAHSIISVISEPR